MSMTTWSSRLWREEFWDPARLYVWRWASLLERAHCVNPVAFSLVSCSKLAVGKVQNGSLRNAGKPEFWRLALLDSETAS